MTTSAKYAVFTCFSGGSSQKEANDNAKALVDVHRQASELLAEGYALQRHDIIPLSNGQALIYLWLVKLP